MAKKRERIACVGGSYPGPDIEDRVFAGLAFDGDPDDPEAIHRGWIDFDAGDDLVGLSPRALASLEAQGVFTPPYELQAAANVGVIAATELMLAPATDVVLHQPDEAARG